MVQFLRKKNEWWSGITSCWTCFAPSQSPIINGQWVEAHSVQLFLSYVARSYGMYMALYHIIILYRTICGSLGLRLFRFGKSYVILRRFSDSPKNLFYRHFSKTRYQQCHPGVSGTTQEFRRSRMTGIGRSTRHLLQVNYSPRYNKSTF